MQAFSRTPTPPETHEDRLARERADWISVALVPVDANTYACRSCGALLPSSVLHGLDAISRHFRFHQELRQAAAR